MKKVIVNCDDFGMDNATNQAIMELIQNKRITSTSILIKRDKVACHEALLFAKQYGNLASFGLHLDLDEYFKFDELGLYGKDETHIIDQYLEIFTTNKQEIMVDIESQFAIFNEYGLQISHVDGHHHIHLFTEILVELLPIMKKYNVNKMRFIADFYLTPKKLAAIKLLLLENSIMVPDKFIDNLTLTGDSTPIDGVNEVMSHVFFGTENGLTHAQKLLTEDCFNGYLMVNYNQI
ncbi:MAG: ChbG/HpnK family deacetylase [Turicibacter sp.]